jgi:hypothetical protein
MATASLDDLPVVDGFRQRGVEMTRIETFTDAAFAFAVTLLVVSIDAIPTSYDELVEALKGVPAFIISFALLFMFWHAHHAWSRRYGLDDFPTIVLSGLLVLLVMIYVYPLKMMSHGIVGSFADMFGVEGPSAIRLSGGDQLQGLFLIYGVGFVAMSATVLGCFAHAYRLRDKLELNEAESYDTVANMQAWGIMAGVGVVSCLLAVTIPDDHPVVLWALPGWVYMLLSVLMPWHGARAGRKRAALAHSWSRARSSAQ